MTAKRANSTNNSPENSRKAYANSDIISRKTSRRENNAAQTANKNVISQNIFTKFFKNQKWRFVLVGGFNTVLDFAIYNFLSLFFAVNFLFVANMISSFCAMWVSFFLNKKWTFRAAGKNYFREIILFFVVTLFGIWVIQSGLIWLMEKFIPLNFDDFWLKNFAKILASVPSLIWNYIMYNKFVFREKTASKDEIEAGGI